VSRGVVRYRGVAFSVRRRTHQGERLGGSAVAGRIGSLSRNAGGMRSLWPSPWCHSALASWIAFRGASLGPSRIGLRFLTQHAIMPKPSIGERCLGPIRRATPSGDGDQVHRVILATSLFMYAMALMADLKFLSRPGAERAFGAVPGIDPRGKRPCPLSQLWRGWVYPLAFLLMSPLASSHGQPAADSTGERRSQYAPLLEAEAVRHGIPPALADAVATVESAYDPEARGSSGEVGLMQILPSTADMLGFRGTIAQLYDPPTNIRLAVRYLAGAWTATGGRLCDTLVKYRAGYGTTTLSPRSVVYCGRALAYLASIKSPLATGPGTENIQVGSYTESVGATVAPTRDRTPFLLTQAELIRMRTGHRTAEDSRRYWAVWEAHIRDRRTQIAVRRGPKSSDRSLKITR
jgi:hypothetical protein